jgi:hypothetical protein
MRNFRFKAQSFFRYFSVTFLGVRNWQPQQSAVSNVAATMMPTRHAAHAREP